MRKTLKADEVNHTFYRWADKAMYETGNKEDEIAVEFYGESFNSRKLLVYGNLDIAYKGETYRIPTFRFSIVRGIQESIISELRFLEDMYYVCTDNEGRDIPIQVKLLIESYRTWGQYPKRDTE